MKRIIAVTGIVIGVSLPAIVSAQPRMVEPRKNPLADRLVSMHRVWKLYDAPRAHSVALSADGKKIVVVGQEGSVWGSSDSGVTWSRRDKAPNDHWTCVTSSADGSYLVAGTGSSVGSGNLFYSTDSGTTWTPTGTSRRPPQGGRWDRMASSGDGRKLIAVIESTVIATSQDGGKGWTDRATGKLPGGNCWWGVASSANGTTLCAVESGDWQHTNVAGRIWISLDSGGTWRHDSISQPQRWSAVASSGDGEKLVAVTCDGQIWTSTDSGRSWVQRLARSGPHLIWNSVASSADGSNLCAVGTTGIFISNDSGATWKRSNFNAKPDAVASSRDGSVLVAVEEGLGSIYTSVGIGGQP